MGKLVSGLVMAIAGFAGLAHVHLMRPPTGLGDAFGMLVSGREDFIEEPYYQYFLAIFAVIALLGTGLLGRKKESLRLLITQQTQFPLFTKRAMWSVFVPLVLGAALIGCASIDQGLMVVSDTISSSDPVTGERQINLESEDQEVQRAEQMTQQLLADARRGNIKLDSETPHYDRVSNVFQQLRTVAHRKHLPWEVYVLDAPDWNAFAIGGGKVFVYSGIFQSTPTIQNDDELAAVLAHEIAHVAARHSSEKQGKLAISKLVDKGIRKDEGFDASFTTIQEDEADRYSVVYMALAGYDPSSGVAVWKRMHAAHGSYTRDMTFDHPLNDDRAKNLAKYSAAAQQYYSPGRTNPNHEEILKKNAVFEQRAPSIAEPGKGGGLAALLETALTSYKEVTAAQIEQTNRQTKRLEQERLAAQRLRIGNLRIADTVDGGQGLFAVAVNSSGKPIVKVIATLEYLNGSSVLFAEDIPLPAMQAFEQKEFGLALKELRYTSVAIRPVYVQLADE